MEEKEEEEEEDSKNFFLSRSSHSDIWTLFYELFRSSRLERLLWRCHEFGGVWVFVSSWYSLVSTAQRQYCIGLCLLLVLRSEGGYIFTDMVDNACRAAVYAGCFAGYDAPRAVFPSIVALADEARGDSTGAVLVQGVMPVVIAFDQTAQKTVEIPQLPLFDKVVHISCRGAEADFCGPTVCRTTGFLLLLDTRKVVHVPVVQVVQLPRWFAVHGHAGDMPVVVNNRCLGLVGRCRNTVDVLQLQFFVGRRLPCRGAEADSHSCSSWTCWYARCCQRQVLEVPQMQFAVMDVAVNLQRQVVSRL